MGDSLYTNVPRSRYLYSHVQNTQTIGDAAHTAIQDRQNSNINIYIGQFSSRK